MGRVYSYKVYVQRVKVIGLEMCTSQDSSSEGNCSLIVMHCQSVIQLEDCLILANRNNYWISSYNN